MLLPLWKYTFEHKHYHYPPKTPQINNRTPKHSLCHRLSSRACCTLIKDLDEPGKQDVAQCDFAAMDHTRLTWQLFFNRFSIQHKWGTKKILSSRIPGTHYRWCHIRARIKVRKPGLAAEFKTYQELRRWRKGKRQQWRGTPLVRNRLFQIPKDYSHEVFNSVLLSMAWTQIGVRK